MNPRLAEYFRDRNIGNFLVRSAQSGTFKCARARCKKNVLSSATLRNCRDPSDPLRSLIILPVPQPMSSTV